MRGVCELCLDAQGGELRHSARRVRHTVVADGNGGQGPVQGVGGRPRTEGARP
jgi:hypothetical protein